MAQTPTPSESPQLKAGDQIFVSVFGHDGYGGDFNVFEDGSIEGRGFGRIVVTGMNTEQLRAEVAKRLSRIIKEPSVTVILRGQRPNYMYVIGITAGQGSGVIPLTPGMDVRQLLARFALPGDPDLLDVTLYRKGGEQRKIDLQGVLQGDPKAWNGILQPDDIVAFLAKPYIRVWFIGPFGKTGQTRLREGLDVYQALAEIGGVSTGILTQDEAHLLVRRGPEVIRVPVRKDPTMEHGMILESGDVVMLDQPKTIRVAISGEVAEPGEQIIRDDLPLAKVVLQAKGVTEKGTLRNVIVFRGSEVIQVDASGPVTGGKPSDFRLQDGDFLYVQRNENFIYTFGEVNRPGKILLEDGRPITAADALGVAGGLSGKGTLRRVHLIRAGKDGKMSARQFNLDEFVKDGKLESNPILQPGDILLFGEPKGFTLGQMAQVLGAAFMIESLVGRR